ncbi:UNVERIFIED_CONTAM: hypothetical protein FKN15_013677 [Acipenser sinensis]
MVKSFSRCWHDNGAGATFLPQLGTNLDLHEEEARLPIGAGDLVGLGPGAVDGAERGVGVQLLRWTGAVASLASAVQCFQQCCAVGSLVWIARPIFSTNAVYRSSLCLSEASRLLTSASSSAEVLAQGDSSGDVLAV